MTAGTCRHDEVHCCPVLLLAYCPAFLFPSREDNGTADRDLEAEAARACALIDRLESTLLAKAFRGGLVPQDPNDEPASVLLDRIRVGRATAPKLKRGRGVNT